MEEVRGFSSSCSLPFQWQESIMKCKECPRFDRGIGCKTGLCKWALYMHHNKLLMTSPEDECHFPSEVSEHDSV